MYLHIQIFKLYYLSILISICLSIYLFVCLSIRLSLIQPFIYRTIYLSFCQSSHLSIELSICLSANLPIGLSHFFPSLLIKCSLSILFQPYYILITFVLFSFLQLSCFYFPSTYRSILKCQNVKAYTLSPFKLLV